MESKYQIPKRVRLFRPLIPKDLEQPCRAAGAEMNLGAREFVILAVRRGLQARGAVPTGWDLSDDEIAAFEGGGGS